MSVSGERSRLSDLDCQGAARSTRCFTVATSEYNELERPVTGRDLRTVLLSSLSTEGVHCEKRVVEHHCTDVNACEEVVPYHFAEL